MISTAELDLALVRAAEYARERQARSLDSLTAVVERLGAPVPQPAVDAPVSELPRTPTPQPPPTPVALEPDVVGKKA